MIDKFKEYINHVNDITQTITTGNISKIIAYIKQIPSLCDIDVKSVQNQTLRNQHPKKYYPIKIYKGQIYNANITINPGSELSENHLVVVVQGFSSNVYGEKVTVLPIEGDGNFINPHYQIQLTNDDLETGHLDKDPSRIIFTDLITLDKARLDRKVGQLKPEKIEEVNSYLIKHLDIKTKQNKSSELTTNED